MVQSWARIRTFCDSCQYRTNESDMQIDYLGLVSMYCLFETATGRWKPVPSSVIDTLEIEHDDE